MGCSVKNVGKWQRSRLESDGNDVNEAKSDSNFSSDENALFALCGKIVRWFCAGSVQCGLYRYSGEKDAGANALN